MIEHKLIEGRGEQRALELGGAKSIDRAHFHSAPARGRSSADERGRIYASQRLRFRARYI